MKFVYSSFILALTLSQCLGGESGLKMMISQEGLDYAANVAVDTYLINLRQDSINDIEGNSGKLNYEFRNIKIEEFPRPTIRASFVEDGQEITWSLSDANFKASSDWKYRFRQNRFLDLRDHGALEIFARGLSIKVALKMEFEQETGRPIIRTSKCESTIQDLDANFKGSGSWLYDTIMGLAKVPLQNLFTDELCRAAKRALNRNANDELRTLEVETNLSGGLLFNFKLVSPPRITQTSLQSLHSGCVYLTGHYDCPTDHPVMDKLTNGRMLGLSLSDKSLNAWARAAYTKGDFNFTILSSHLEDEHEHYFDTDCNSGICIASFIEDVEDDYPNSKLEVDFITLYPPTLSITHSKLSGNIVAMATMFVRTPNSERFELFKIHTSTNLELMAEMHKNVLRFKITDFRWSQTVISSNSKGGGVSGNSLHWSTEAVGKVLVNKSNLRGQQGIPLLKMRDLRLRNSTITFEEGYLHMSTDVLYDRPAH